MKVRNFLAMMVMAFCSMAIVSCGDDDDDPVLPSASEVVSGEYVGTNTLTVGDSNMPSENNVAKIIPQSADVVTVVLPQPQGEQPKGGMAMPEIILKDIKLVNAGQGVYTFSADKIDVVSGEMHILGKGMTGEVKGNTLSLKYNFKPGKMPMEIEGSFVGTKK